MFKCKTCPEKDERIQELKDQIEYLRSLVFPNNDPFKITYSERTADATLSAEVIPADAVEETDEELTRAEAVLRELDSTLSGNY